MADYSTSSAYSGWQCAEAGAVILLICNFALLLLPAYEPVEYAETPRAAVSLPGGGNKTTAARAQPVTAV